MNLYISNFSLIYLVKSRYTYLFVFVLLLGGVTKEWIDKSRQESEGTSHISRMFWLRKTFAESNYDFVIAGDSRAYCGVSPAYVSDFLQSARGINLGYPLVGWTEEYCHLIEDKLDPDGMRIIILGVSPHSLLESALANSSLRQYMDTPPLESLLVSQCPTLVSWFSSIKIMDVIFFALHRGPFVPSIELCQLERQIGHNNGWIESWADVVKTEGSINFYRRKFENEQISEDVLGFLCERISKWNNEGIRVFCIRLPASREIEKIENIQSGFVEGVVATSVVDAGGNWLFLDGRQSYHTYDGSHLSREDAIRLSRYLGSIINEHLQN